MKIEAKWLGNMHFQSTSATNHTIEMDSGPKDAVTAGPTPMELVLQAIAGCSGMDVLSILRKKRKEPDEFNIEIDAERAEEHPKVFKKVNLFYRIKKKGLTKEEAEQAIGLSVDKYCSVMGMVRSTAEISWKYEIVE